MSSFFWYKFEADVTYSKTATSSEDFNTVLASVVTNCDEIGSYIQDTDFIAKQFVEDSELHVRHIVIDPLEYLKGWRWTRSWDDYFSHIMDLWDEDRMSAMRFNSLIERLSAPAARLDALLPKLEKQCDRLPNMPVVVLRNAREMQTSVNSFLNSADEGLNFWKRGENILVQSEIRQRRPIIPQSPVPDGLQVNTDALNTAKQSKDRTLGTIPIQNRLNSVLGTLTVRLSTTFLGLTGTNHNTLRAVLRCWD
ncbi:MAG: hypothetical protein Q9170_001970 [Blastenia crenularia]